MKRTRHDINDIRDLGYRIALHGCKMFKDKGRKEIKKVTDCVYF